MSEMTPEGLRIVWRELERSRDIDDALQCLELAVPAWEADRRAKNNYLEGLCEAGARIEALEKTAKAYLNWHRRQKLEPESLADVLNDELEEDRLGDELCAALAKEDRP